MDADVFCDLNDFTRSDPDFNLDDYNKAVLDSGVYKGKRYIMPLDYQSNILVTTKEAMAQAGMNAANLQSFDGLAGEIKKYLETHASAKLVYNYTRRSYAMLFPWCGLKLIDYENKKANVDGDDFKKAMEAYKDIYKQDQEAEPRYINDTDLDAVVKGLISGEYLFYKPYAMNFFAYNYSPLSVAAQSPIYFPALSTEGKKVGSVRNSAAILKSSRNKKNAYAFLKILLSEDIQDADPVEMPISFNPVLNNAMEKRIKSFGEYRDAYEGKATSVSEEILREYGSMQTDVDECQLYTGIPEVLLKEIFTNYMLPYFKNEDSYENCLNKTRNFLELYLSE
jgi:ABC-type glycerol-3-phosphate transport system substrate-binding protein